MGKLLSSVSALLIIANGEQLEAYPWRKYSDVPREPTPVHADAAQGGVTTNPDGSIAYRHVPIVEEKQK